MSADTGNSQATNSNVTTGDSVNGTADTSKHIGHDTNEWKTVTIEPDYCNVGGTVPFDSYATLDNSLVCSPDVIARGTEVYRQGDLYQGTQSNAGAGIHSGVSQDAAQVRFLEGNSGVVVNNLPVIEQGRHALINTTPYGYNGAYSQTLTCEAPISPEKRMQDYVDYLFNENQRMENERIPELQSQLADYKYQYNQTSPWFWQERDIKSQLSEQIADTQHRIENNQDAILRNSREMRQLNDILHPKVPGEQYLEAGPSNNELAAINRENERYQRWIENIDNWRTGPIMAGPAMIANANGAPIEVVQQLRAAGEGLGMGAVGLRGSSIRGTNSSTLPVRGLTYQPKPTGTYIRPTNINTVTVYRVEGTPNTRVLIGANGEVNIQGKKASLYLNFGDKARALEFYQQKLSQNMPGATIKTFRVPSGYLDKLRSLAIPESEVGIFGKKLPVIADPTKADNQFGIRPNMIKELENMIIQGSGHDISK